MRQMWKQRFPLLTRQGAKYADVDDRYVFAPTAVEILGVINSSALFSALILLNNLDRMISEIFGEANTAIALACVTDLAVYSHAGSMAQEREMKIEDSTLQWSTIPLRTCNSTRPCRRRNDEAAVRSS